MQQLFFFEKFNSFFQTTFYALSFTANKSLCYCKQKLMTKLEHFKLQRINDIETKDYKMAAIERKK